MKLVQRRAASEDQLVAEVLVLGDRTHGTGQQKVLFHLIECRPRM
jgi:hypothetical protein